MDYPEFEPFSPLLSPLPENLLFGQSKNRTEKTVSQSSASQSSTQSRNSHSGIGMDDQAEEINRFNNFFQFDKNFYDDLVFKGFLGLFTSMCS